MLDRLRRYRHPGYTDARGASPKQPKNDPSALQTMLPLMPPRLHQRSCPSNERPIVSSPGDSGDSQIVATVMKPRDNYMRRPAQDRVTCAYSRYVSSSWPRFEYLICARVLVACLFLCFDPSGCCRLRRWPRYRFKRRRMEPGSWMRCL